MWIKNFFNELKAWHIVRKVYRQHKSDFDKIGIKSDWFGKLYIVLNRDPEIVLGSDEDEVILHNELAKIWAFITQLNIGDILAYELKPLEEEVQINESEVEYEHAYLVTFTPAWNLEKQFVTTKSVISFIVVLGGIITGLVFLLKYLI